MTFGRFVLKNSMRNKRRTAFTVLSIGFSLFLLIMIQTVLRFFNNPPTGDTAALRLVVQRTTTFLDQLPYVYWDALEKVPHVKKAVPVQIYGGYYKDPKNIFPSLATDPLAIWEIFPEQHLSEEAKAAFAAERTGAIIGEKLVERFGWKIGDKVTLIGSLQPIDLEFKIVGIYTSDLRIQKDAFYFRYDYLNEAMGSPGTVAFFWLLADDASSMPGIIENVDAMFRNTPAETKTQTEKAFMVGFISMLGNIKALMGSISLVVLFTMLLVAASTIAMTIRERYREVGILKAIGYPRRAVLGLIMGEAMLISAFGGLFGCGLAAGMRYVDLYEVTQGFIQDLTVAPGMFAVAFTTALGIGFFSSILPAVRASGLTITDAMRRME